MEKLMALYGISSPSGREGKMAKFIIEELKKMEIPFRQDRYGNIYAVKGNRESYPVSWRTWMRYTGARQALMQPILWRTR